MWSALWHHQPDSLRRRPRLVPGGVPLFTYGNMGRNVLRGPGINDWDISIMKNFKFTESKSLQFQSNFFNAFNHVQFYGPTSGSGSVGGASQFGAGFDRYFTLDLAVLSRTANYPVCFKDVLLERSNRVRPVLRADCLRQRRIAHAEAGAYVLGNELDRGTV